MFSTKEVGSSINDEKNENYRMTHSLSMDDANYNIEKRKTNIFSGIMSIFGSVGNIVSKIPNLMTSMNNTLSVTVLPNSTITSEDLLRNLTGNNEHITTNNMYASKSSNFKELLGTNDIDSQLILSHDNFVDNKMLTTFDWIKQMQQIQPNHQQTNYFDFAIAESLNLMDKNYNNDIDKLNLNNINTDKSSHCKKMYIDKMKVDETVIDIDTDVPESQMNIDEELLLKKSLTIKSRRRCNFITNKCRKSKGKLQLRKSGVSQSKHRKERIKHNLYSNIQDDLDTWEDNLKINNTDKIDDEISQITSNESDSSYEIIPNHPMLIDSYVLGDSTKTKDCKNKKLEKSKPVQMTHKVEILPDKKNVDPSFVIRERSISINSTDSDDFSIVFAGSDGSDCGTDDEDNEEDDEDDEDDDEEDIDEDDEEDDDYEDYKEEDYNQYEKKEKKSTNTKVQFNLQPTVHTMIKWNFAYRAARRGPWEEMARDRDRFKGRIHRVGRELDQVLNTQHRDCIWHKRFATE